MWFDYRTQSNGRFLGNIRLRSIDFWLIWVKWWFAKTDCLVIGCDCDLRNISRRCPNKFEQKSQSNQSNIIEGNRIIAVRLTNSIKSQSNGWFLGNIRLCLIDFWLVQLIVYYVILVWLIVNQLSVDWSSIKLVRLQYCFDSIWLFLTANRNQ